MTGLVSAENTAEWIARRRGDFALKPVRQQFGETMLELAAEHDNLLLLTADLMYATGLERFGATYPDRLINLGIAEQNMTGVAAGLALCGKLPVVSGYAAFTTLRALEQAKLDCAYNQVKVILVGQSAGLSYGVGGPTHQTYEDLAIMRAIPNMMVVVPSDPHEVDAALRACVSLDCNGPIYVRLGRGPEYIYDDTPSSIELGKARPLRAGGDIGIIATGAMVFEALLAAEALRELGIEAAVVNLHTLKPFDGDGVRAAMAGVRGIIVIEEHSTIGGLGSAVLEALDGRLAAPIVRVGLDDAFPPIGPPFALRAALGLSADNIVAKALGMLALQC
jgi:transketolase